MINLIITGAILAFLVAYYYGKTVSKRKVEVKTIVKAGNYPKGLLNED